MSAEGHRRLHDVGLDESQIAEVVTVRGKRFWRAVDRRRPTARTAIGRRRVEGAAYQRNATPMLARQKVRPDSNADVTRWAGASLTLSDELLALK